MKETLNKYEIADRLSEDENSSFTYSGAMALAEHLEDLEADLGEELEFDKVAIRCDFSQYESLIDWATDYFSQWRGDLDIDADLDEEDDLEEIEEIIREYIQDHGTLIEFDDGIIVSSF
jgi:hypothetical protein